jgi:hypothetical protein
MTDEQFDEICRSALSFEPGTASASAWRKIRPPRWAWLPTIPEILACGCACALALFAIGGRFRHDQFSVAERNPVIQRAIGRSLAGLQVSSAQLPDTTQWAEPSLSLPPASRTLKREAR